jgi:thiol:disulfide interchange protein
MRLIKVLALATTITIAGAALGAQTMQSMPAQKGMAMDTTMKNDLKPFTKEAHAKAMAEGKTTLVFFHAPWCPVCRAQEPKVLAHLNGDAKHVVAFRVDYDSNMALRKEMNVQKQSTLILFDGMKETARLSYKSDDASVSEFFAHAMMKMGGGK